MLVSGNKIRFSRKLASARLCARSDNVANPPGGSRETLPCTAELADQTSHLESVLERGFQSVADSIEEFENRRRQMLNEVRYVAIELGIAVASKLTYRQIEGDDDYIRPIIDQLMQNLDQTTTWQLVLSPQDYQSVTQTAAANATSADGQFSFAKDPGLSAGDFRIESPQQNFVSSVQTKLAEIRQFILEDIAHVTVERRSNDINDQKLGRFPDRRSSQ